MALHRREDSRGHNGLVTIKSKARTAAKRLLRRPSPRQTPCLTSNSYEEPGNQWYRPTIGGASTLAEFVVGGAVVRDALAILERLTPDRYQEYLTRFYRTGLDRFGDRWRYADINTVLIGLARVLQPSAYLEIGVRRGRSLAMLASQAPACHIVGCDLFIEHYAGMENPGPDFVRAELGKLEFTGQLDFLVGDSHDVLPKYFKTQPDAFFDLITVDGDHSEAGAIGDLRTVMPRVKIGGALIFDDVSNPAHPKLRRVWSETIASRPDFSAFTFDEIGFGVGLAVRHA
jgi:predicted O-methyltransferase YrrM